MNILFPYMARWKAVNWTRYHSLLTCVAEMGHTVYVLQPPKDSQSLETNFQEIEVTVPRNLNLIDIKIPGWMWNKKFPLDKLIKKGLYSLFSLKIANKIIKEKKIDVILLYNIPQYPFLRLPVRKKIFDYADDYIAMLVHELGVLSNPITVALGNWLLNQMIKNSDVTFAVSNILAKSFDHPIKVLPNGVDPKKVEYAKKHSLNLNLKKPVVGFIGSFEYFIDLDLIIGIAVAMPEITFLLVGQGRLLEYVKQQVSRKKLQNVVLPGGVEHQDVFRYIDQMDICLNIFKKISISHGACPIKLFEYLSMGKPVISTRLDELDYIDKEYLIYGDNVQEAVSGIQKILSNQNLKKRIVNRGYKEAIAHYTWPSISTDFINELEKIDI